ncbi:hypothetical protein [Dethiosulfatarculus sandiegensis]|uniref:hypothetical protein n=1 Tax=Dethiosulfatarculus sandiegensis TaxID=1429043 RepID=UPI0009E68FB5|nr:hypothetical protein [Dethiosulfatarculus sandiegensis]
MTTDYGKKHNCPDCRQCQHCSEVRCSLCRGQGCKSAEGRFREMSIAEQIELYESLNRPRPKNEK